jgi:hypothetical protein
MSASQATAFYRDVAAARRVWTVRDADGFPAPISSRGVRAQPFWSSLGRVDAVIRGAAAYKGFSPVEITWEEFRDRWLPSLARDGLEVGVNWSGAAATGYDLSPEAVRKAIEWQIEHGEAAI